MHLSCGTTLTPGDGSGGRNRGNSSSRLKTDSREPATYCFNGDPVAVSYTGGLGPIRDIGRIVGAGGAKKPSYWACAAILEGFEYYGSWEPGNGSETGKALRAGGEGEEA